MGKKILRRGFAVLMSAMLLTGCGSDSMSEEWSQAELPTTTMTTTDTTQETTTTTTIATTTTARSTKATTKATTTTSATTVQTTVTTQTTTRITAAPTQTQATTTTTMETTTIPMLEETEPETEMPLQTDVTETTMPPEETEGTEIETTMTTVFVSPMEAPTSQLNRLIANYPRGCGITIYSTDGVMLYQYQPEKQISGASLIKLPYAVYCCQQLEMGVHSLDETVTYTKSWYHGGSGIIRKGAYGVKYTIAQLLDYSMRYSDNVAYDMLVSLFGIDGFNEMVASWGYTTTITYSRFPAVSALFMNHAMLEMRLHAADSEPWEICWDALVHSETSLVRPVIGGDGTDVAVKYGSIQNQYHEVCYVEAETPYILVILSGAVNYKSDASFVQSVAAAAKDLTAAYQWMLDNGIKQKGGCTGTPSFY